MAKRTQFKQGHPKFGGRTKGTPNKANLAAIRSHLETLLNRNEAGGIEGYLAWLAVEYPGHFVRVLCEALPKDIAIRTDEPLVFRWSGEKPA